MTGWFENNRSELGKRLPAFQYFVDHLPSGPNIVETGSLRSPGNVAGDGNATMLFDELTAAEGYVWSIDINPDLAAVVARECGEQVMFIAGDSVKELAALPQSVTPVDLLYLDSLDVDFEHDELAARHALHELQAALRLLSATSLVAVDDNNEYGRGKGRLVAEFAALKGWQLVVDGYVKVWSCADGHR